MSGLAKIAQFGKDHWKLGVAIVGGAAAAEVTRRFVVPTIREKLACHYDGSADKRVTRIDEAKKKLNAERCRIIAAKSERHSRAQAHEAAQEVV
jgi:hypothetical protein